MSRETSEWLNNNVLIGFEDRRGKAWHYRASDQGAEPNHYAGAVPVEDVQRRLFDWEPVEMPVYVGIPHETPAGVDEDGTIIVDKTTEYVAIKGKKAMVPSDDPNHVFGIFSEGYQGHSYGDWLIGNVAHILDGELAISSAGLLKKRAVAWVEVSVADTIQTNHGIDFRPNLLATTSFDGTVQTTYKRTCTMTVCDNTYGMAMAEQGQTFKVKHSKYSNLKKLDAAEALDIVHRMSEDIAAELDALCEVDVTDDEFRKLVELAVPIDGNTSKTGTTVGERKRGELLKLWSADDRVSRWQNTGFAAVQAFNTWEHHFKATRGDTQLAERNMLGAINGAFEKGDAEIVSIMRKLELLPA